MQSDILRSIRCITFDLDDTLWPLKETIINAEKKARLFLAETEPDLAAKINYDDFYVLRERLIKENPDLSHQLTLLRKIIYTEALKSAGENEANSSTLASGMLTCFLHQRNKVTPFKGIEETLETLSKDFFLGAITNGNVQFDHLGLAKHFKFSINAELAGCAKPDKRIFALAFAELKKYAGTNLEPQKILHVGDDIVTDVGGAQDFGFRSCWIKHAASDEPTCKPDLALSSVNDLLLLFSESNRSD